jgi:hypothetical protein
VSAPPPEGKCERCKQTRPLFAYKPEHDCVEDAGTMNLIDAASYIAEIEDNGDTWCMRRIERRLHKPYLCVRCHDTEADRERTFIRDVLND